MGERGENNKECREKVEREENGGKNEGEEDGEKAEGLKAGGG